MLLQPQVSAVLLYSIAAAAMLIYLPFVLVAYARASLGYEALSNPRTVFDKLPTYAQRATWAHQNSFEQKCFAQSPPKNTIKYLHFRWSKRNMYKTRSNNYSGFS